MLLLCIVLFCKSEHPEFLSPEVFFEFSSLTAVDCSFYFPPLSVCSSALCYVSFDCLFLAMSSAEEPKFYTSYVPTSLFHFTFPLARHA